MSDEQQKHILYMCMFVVHCRLNIFSTLSLQPLVYDGVITEDVAAAVINW